MAADFCLALQQMNLSTFIGSSSQAPVTLNFAFLLHAVSKAGGSRFTVGSSVRCPPNQARLHQFEALHKTHFFDAWRNEPILNRVLRATSAGTQTPATGEPDGSLAPDDIDLISSDGQPCFLPLLDSTHSVTKLS